MKTAPAHTPKRNGREEAERIVVILTFCGAITFGLIWGITSWFMPSTIEIGICDKRAGDNGNYLIAVNGDEFRITDSEVFANTEPPGTFLLSYTGFGQWKSFDEVYKTSPDLPIGETCPE